MPSSKFAALLARARAQLAPVDEAVERSALVVTHVALALLIASGEAIRWVDYRDTLVSAPMLRAVHALVGLLLAATLLLRIGRAALRGVATLLGSGAAGRSAAFHHLRHPSAALLLDAAWWLVVGGLVLSGLERYWQLRHGVSYLPLLSAPAWWVLHRPLLPYLYAILLITAAVRGRLAVRRALSYLYTP